MFSDEVGSIGDEVYEEGSQCDIDAEEELAERDKDDYDVYASWEADENEFVGCIELVEEATFLDMPKELEINGFTYRLEE